MSYRSKEERLLVAFAKRLGWRLGDRNGVGHLTLHHPATGKQQSIPGACVGNGCAFRNARAQLKRGSRHDGR